MLRMGEEKCGGEFQEGEADEQRLSGDKELESVAMSKRG